MNAATFLRHNDLPTRQTRRWSRGRRAAALGALAFTLIGAGATADAAATAPSPALAAPLDSARLMPAATTQQNVVTNVNAQRRARGLAPLTMSTALTNAAQGQANYMASSGRMSHTGSGSSTVGQRVTRAGFRWSVVGENVAYGQTSSGAVVAAWMASPPHAANMLDARFTYVGVGIAFAHGVYWWSLTMARLG